MILKQEELFEYDKSKINMIVITTNGVITKAGRLVMGRGCAKQLLTALPDIDLEIAEVIDENSLNTKKILHDFKGKACRVTFHTYGFLPVRNPVKTGKTGIGIFQVKETWWSDALPWLIEYSAKTLGVYANEHPAIHFRMAFPGIGNGRLDPKVVLPIIEKLPDNVVVCHRGI